MKALIISAFAILIPFFYIFFYVYDTARAIAFRDDMYLIKGGFIESYCKGTLTVADLWRSSQMTRSLGYNFLQIVNIKWFGMNSRFIILLIPFLMLFSAILIYRDYRNSLRLEHSNEYVAATFFFLALILFNIIQWEGLTFGYGFVFHSPMPFFIATFIALDALVSTGSRKYWFLSIILSSLAVLVFGGSHAISFAPALGATFICYVLTRRRNLPTGFWLRALLISVFLSAIAFLYIHGIEDNNYFPGSSPKVDAVWANPFKVIQFLMAALGASIVGVDVANAYFSFNIMVVVGLIVLFFYTLAIAFFFISLMYERTYLPFYLIMQTFFYLGFMAIGRFGLGIDYGMASRYTCVSHYGIVAIAWVFIFILSGPLITNARWRNLLFIPLVLIFLGTALTAAVEWRIQPHRKAYSEKLHDIARRVDMATPEELSKFEERPDLVRDSLMLLREYRLNAYHSGSGANTDAVKYHMRKIN